MLIAPHLRAMGLYTVPDFFHVRFGGRWPRIIAALAAVLCSFTYVVAQIYGVGLIASRLTGVQFEIGIMLGLGGVLLLLDAVHAFFTRHPRFKGVAEFTLLLATSAEGGGASPAGFLKITNRLCYTVCKSWAGAPERSEGAPAQWVFPERYFLIYQPSIRSEISERQPSIRSEIFLIYQQSIRSEVEIFF
jgi:hypothetical protein